MKKCILLLLSAIMILAIPTAIANAYYTLPLDVGNFNDYGGGGDWGGGDFGGGGDYDFGGGNDNYYYGDAESEDSLSNFIISMVVIIIFFVIFITAFNNQKRVRSSYSSHQTPVQFMPRDFTTQITDYIKQSDTDFSSEKFIAWSKNIFITLQTAWTERDWEKIRTIEKEELFEQHNTQLQEYIRLGRINVIERINVNQAFLHKYVCDENYEHLTVCMNVRMIDYIIDERSRNLLKGDKNNDIFMTYLLTFMRKKGVKTTILNGVVSSSCPHCGAPVDSASAGKCEYCGSVVHTGEFNWVLSDMQAVKPGFQNDNRGIIIIDDHDKN